jgi:putative CocE/NonD family hydrolase
MRLSLLTLIVFLSTSFLTASSQEIRAIYTADVAMRDGVKLAADVYLPSASGTFPTIVYRTPYDPRGDLVPPFIQSVTSHGFALVINHCRGRYDSAGSFWPFVSEGKDTYDLLNWVVKQPWCNGKIGTTGASYCGMLQWQVAAFQHPNVKAMFIMVSPSDAYKDIVYPGGAFTLQTMCNWLTMVSRRTVQDWRFTEWQMVMGHLPTYTMDEELGRSLPVLRQYMSQPTYGPFWKNLFCIDDVYSKVNVPTFLVTGWNDPFVLGTLRSFNGLQNAHKADPQLKDKFQILVGPWDHLGSITGLGTIFGEENYGPAAKVDVTAASIAWFEKWLLDKPPAIWQNDPVRIFVTGKNQWTEESRWPPERSKDELLFLHSSGHANTLNGDGKLLLEQPQEEEPDNFIYDPALPMPSLSSRHILFGSGPRDTRLNEKRADMLVFTSEPAPADLYLAGNPRVTLFVRSDAPDTDFSAWLCDVYPDGKSMALQDGIVRCSQFFGKSPAATLQADKSYKVEIELGSMAHVIKAGHRIRLDISSSDFPAFDRNLNTGRENWKEVKFRSANQSVLHSRESASHLVLPIVSPPVANRRTGAELRYN